MNDKNIKIMRDDKIKSALLKLSIPVIAGMFISALYSVVDAYFVGGLGTAQMAAVSVVFPIAQVAIGLGLLFGSGASSYISRLLGRGENMQANRTASTALFTSVLAGVIFISLSLWFLDDMLLSLGATQSILPYARAYAVIYLAGSILTVFNVTMNNIVISEGAVKLNLLAMSLGCGLNIVLDPIFIYTLGWGVEGAAIATVIAQAVTFVFYLYYIVMRKGFLRFSIFHFNLDKKIHSEIIKIGLPILALQILTAVSIGLTNMAASDYGDSAVAAMGVVTRILTLGAYVIFGYVKGFQPLVGYNFGARHYARLHETLKVSLNWVTIFCGAVSIVMIAIPEFIVSLFSESDLELIRIGSRALRANGVTFFFFGFVMVYGSLFLAIGKAKDGGLVNISRQGLFFIPIILLLPAVMGLEGIIYAQAIADSLTIVLTWFLARKLNKTLKELLDQRPLPSELMPAPARQGGAL